MSLGLGGTQCDRCVGLGCGGTCAPVSISSLVSYLVVFRERVANLLVPNSPLKTRGVWPEKLSKRPRHTTLLCSESPPFWKLILRHNGPIQRLRLKLLGNYAWPQRDLLSSFTALRYVRFWSETSSIRWLIALYLAQRRLRCDPGQEAKVLPFGFDEQPCRPRLQRF